MITKNFKNIVATLITAGANVGMLPVTIESGSIYYVSASFSLFPYSVSGGIKVGNGSTQPTENDYGLNSRIDSGLTTSQIINRGVDNESAYIEFIITLTNTSSSNITVSEIGYFPLLRGSSTQGASGNTQLTVMLDRTILDEAVVIPANGNAVIKYRISGSVSTASVA